MRLFIKFIQFSLLALALSSCFDFETKRIRELDYVELTQLKQTQF